MTNMTNCTTINTQYLLEMTRAFLESTETGHDPYLYQQLWRELYLWEEEDYPETASLDDIYGRISDELTAYWRILDELTALGYIEQLD